MHRRLVFIPIERTELAAIAGRIQLTDREAHTVTPALIDALGYRPEDTEEAEYAALVLASVAALSRFGERLVLVAEVPPQAVSAGDDPANGHCRVSEVTPGAITCWFEEEDGVDATTAARAAKGRSLDDAWDQDAVSALIQGHQLLWNDVVEYRAQA